MQDGFMRKRAFGENPKRCYEKKGITVLPGSFLGREVNGVNPGSGYIRIALVATVPEVTEAAKRIAEFDPFEE